MTCAHCAGTGSLSKTVEGYLDCTHCDTATERTLLEHWVMRSAPNCVDNNAAWLIYQHGKAAVAATTE